LDSFGLPEPPGSLVILQAVKVRSQQPQSANYRETLPARASLREQEVESSEATRTERSFGAERDERAGTVSAQLGSTAPLTATSDEASLPPMTLKQKAASGAVAAVNSLMQILQSLPKPGGKANTMMSIVLVFVGLNLSGQWAVVFHTTACNHHFLSGLYFAF
jgi:hypothetical protein